MGLFSFVGRALKKVAKVALRGVTKLALPVLRAGASTLTHGLSERAIRAVHLVKNAGMSAGRGVRSYDPATQGRELPPVLMNRFPVLKLPSAWGGIYGGSPGHVSSASTPWNTPGPHQFVGGKRPGGDSGAPGAIGRPRRAAAKKKPKKRSTARRGGRKLKFGSPAFRKRYLGHRRRKRAA